MLSQQPKLFSPLTLRGLTLRNRICVSPMCMYTAENGVVGDWHLVHLGRFALGGAGIVFVEATAVEARGRLTHGDTGIWSDDHVAGLARIAHYLKAQGAAAGIQLAHAGRKGSMTRPWHGMTPLPTVPTAGEEAAWGTISSCDAPLDEKSPPPRALSLDDIKEVKQAWIDAAKRARDAGFDIVEVHSAHGYLLQQFLSPLVNTRTDAYGGDIEARMRLPLEIAEVVRKVWPSDRPVFVRISAVDGVEGGWSLDDSVVYSKALKERGIDVIDCSSGGIVGSIMKGVPRGLGFQVPFAQRIRQDADIVTMAVGLIVDPQQAEEIIRENRADLVALARESLFDPQWALHAAYALRPEEDIYSQLPVTHSWWLKMREPMIRKLRASKG